MVTERHEQVRKCFSLPTIWLLQAPIHFTFHVCQNDGPELLKGTKPSKRKWFDDFLITLSYPLFAFSLSLPFYCQLSINISLFVLPCINSLHLLILKPKELTLVSQIFATIFVVEMATPQIPLKPTLPLQRQTTIGTM